MSTDPWAIALTIDPEVGCLHSEDRRAVTDLADAIHAHHVAPLLARIAELEASPGDSVRRFVQAQPRLAGCHVDTDRDLLARTVEGLRRRGERLPLWSVVGAWLGHGSGVSWAICKALDLDPDATSEVKRG